MDSKTQESVVTQERLQRINEQIYKRNAELAVRNKTLSLLRQLYEITTLTLAPKGLADRLVERIRAILNFEFVGILIIDRDKKYLVPFAASFPDKTDEQTRLVRKEYAKIKIPLSSQENICVAALRTKEKKQTEKFSDILKPSLSESAISTIQKSSRIQTVLIYPLLTENRELGVLVFSLKRKAKDLNLFEKESIANLVNVVAVALDKALLHEELKVLTKKLEGANKELKRLDAAKSEFISIASHQLRTPLTAVKGYISLVVEGSYGKLPEKMKRPIRNVYDSNERLIRLVNDLLSISRMESGRMDIDLQKVKLQDVIESVIQELNIKAKEKNIKLIFS